MNVTNYRLIAVFCCKKAPSFQGASSSHQLPAVNEIDEILVHLLTFNGDEEPQTLEPDNIKPDVIGTRAASKDYEFKLPDGIHLTND